MKFLRISLIIFSVFLIYNLNYVNASGDYNYSVESITLDTEKPYEDIETTITIILKNYSTNSLTTLSEINSYTFSADSFSQTSITLPDVSDTNPIDNNEVFSYSIKGKFTSLGEKNISFKNTHSSNSKSLNVEVVPAEDISVDGFEISPEKPTVNEECQIKVKIKNSGKSNLGTGLGLYSYNFSFPNFVKTEIETPSVSWRDTFDAGEYIYFTFLGKFTSIGEKNIEFLLDESDQLEENNEENNENSVKVTVINKKELDLIIDEIEIENDYALMDEQSEIIVKVKNIGEVSLVNGIGLGSDNIYLYSSNFASGDVIVDEIPTADNPFEPDDIFTYTFQGSFTKTGVSRLDVKINNKNLLSESDTNNNATSTDIIVHLNQEKADEFTITKEKIVFKNFKEATISWETSQETDSELTIKERSIYSDPIIIENVNNAEEFKVELTDLYPGLSYFYKIKAVNGLADDESEYIAFTAPANNNLFLRGNLEQRKDIDNIIINWDTNLLSSGYVYYKLKSATDYTKAGVADLSIEHEIVLENLEGEYDYYLESISDDDVVYKSSVNSFSINIPSDTNSTGDTSGSNNNDSDDDNGNKDDVVVDDSSKNDLKIEIKNTKLYDSLKGKIVLKVESNGEAYYVNPVDKKMSYLGRPDDAFEVMRSEGVGVSSSNLAKIPVALGYLDGVDSDGDGLSDLLEDAIGADKNKSDTDGDGFNDMEELKGGYDILGSGKISYDSGFSEDQKGKIFLDVENNGEAWYINPSDGKRYFLGRPSDAFSVMRELGLGISNSNFNAL